jgi:hypothetical protein
MSATLRCVRASSARRWWKLRRSVRPQSDPQQNVDFLGERQGPFLEVPFGEPGRQADLERRRRRQDTDHGEHEQHDQAQPQRAPRHDTHRVDHTGRRPAR